MNTFTDIEPTINPFNPKEPKYWIIALALLIVVGILGYVGCS